jgi:flagellar biosynthetic protein FliO
MTHSSSSALWWPLLATLLIVVSILGLAWWMKHVGLTPLAQLQGRFKVLMRCAIGPREQLVIVSIDDHCLLLGVTAHSIQLLDRFEALEDEFPPSNPTRSFKDLVDRLKNKNASVKINSAPDSKQG